MFGGYTFDNLNYSFIMSLQKKFLKSKPICKVTFKLDSDIALDAKKAAIVGDFNNWDPKKGKMDKMKSGPFKATVDLETGKSYQFRYVLDGKIWENDESADDYVPTGVSLEENCVVAV